MNTLEVDGLIVPPETIVEFDQSYDEVSAGQFRRTADGGGVAHVLYGDKLSTVISGKGWAPSALRSLKLYTQHVFKCAMADSIDATGTSITLPAARRSDAGHEPFAYALVGDRLVPTTISGIVSNVATLVAVDGAVGYRVHYFPQITAIITRNTCKADSLDNFTWQLEAEQV